MTIRDLIRSANSNLLRNKSRTILTIIAIFIGSFTIALTVGINIGVNNYVDKQLSGMGSSNQLVIYPKQEMGSPMNSDDPQPYEPSKQQAQQRTLTSTDFENMKKIKGLTDVSPMTNFSVDYIQGVTSTKYVFNASTDMVEGIDLVAGREVDKKTPDYELVLAESFVKELGFKNSEAALNQSITIGATENGTGQQQEVKANIVGVRSKSIIQGGASVVNQALSDRLLHINETGLPEQMQGQVYVATGSLPKDATADDVTRAKTELSDMDLEGQTMADQIGIIKNVVNGITGVLTMFGAIALLAASFGIINTLYMSVQERTREIGLMKAMGMSGGKIFTLFSVEALLIGFWGSVVGIGGAMGVGKLINHYAKTSFLEGLEGFTLVEFNLSSALTITGLIMLIAFLAGTFPAKRAAKLDPITALRYE